ncbi:hypothetical protein IMSAG013_01025 [Clostridiales bacterium]|nr:hypothetical protein IMSAG013_01025 [Clostridiales bacterium]
MKKLLLCGLAAVMILSFAACGNNSGDKNDAQSGKQSQTGMKQGAQELVPEWVDGETYTPPISEPVDDGEDVRKNSAPGNQTEDPDQHKVQGHGVHELVPEWVDGQEYPQGEDEPVDDGANAPSDGNQKEEPNQHIIAPN